MARKYFRARGVIRLTAELYSALRSYISIPKLYSALRRSNILLRKVKKTEPRVFAALLVKGFPFEGSEAATR